MNEVETNDNNQYTINTPMEENQSLNTKNSEVNKSSGITIFSMALFILFALGVVAFLYYQNQQLKEMLSTYQMPASPSPTPVATEDPMVGWKSYTNPIDKFSFKYPGDWAINTKDEKGDKDKRNIIVKLTKNKASIQFYADMYGIGGVGQDYKGTPITIDGKALYRYKTENDISKTTFIGITDELTKSLGFFKVGTKSYSITLSYPQTLTDEEILTIEKEFDMILSTFKFALVIPTPGAMIQKVTPIPISSASGVSRACTMDAKICPDGSTVGRVAPSCEFAPCPVSN